MFTEKYLLDSFEATGDNVPAFAACLEEMLHRTSFEKVRSGDLHVLSLIESEGEGFLYFYDLNPHNLYTGVSTNPLNTPRVSLSEAKILSKGNFGEIINELKKTEKICLFDGKKTYFVSQNMFSTMDVYGMKGAFLDNPCLIRDLMVANQFAVDKESTLVVRTFGNARKVFAILSKNYTPVSQMFLVDIINSVDKEGVMGKSACRSWNISHYMSSIIVEFPEKAEEMAILYGLPHVAIPGICLSTSDTGDCSLIIRGTWRVGNSISLAGTEIKRKHIGKIDVDEIMKDVETSIFSQYTKLPEALCNLMLENVIEPSMSLTAKKRAVEGLVKSLFKQIGMVKAVGKKTEMSLYQQIVDEIDYSLPLTAYDICISILSIPERISGLSKSYTQPLQEAVGHVPYAKYAAATAATPILV